MTNKADIDIETDYPTTEFAAKLGWLSHWKTGVSLRSR